MALHASLYPTKRKNTPSPITLWRRLEVLKDLGNLNIETNSRFSLVTIVNYDVYNTTTSENEQPIEQPVNSQRTAGEQPVNTKKKEKKVNKVEEGKKKGGGAGDVPIPKELDSESFRTAWNNWLAYRRKRRLTLTDMTLTAQLKNLSGWGQAKAIESIDASISHGWAGIFEPKGNSNGKPSRQIGPGQQYDPNYVSDGKF
jgi:hypothetical protein